jgi:hypothetical protein
MNRMVNAPLLWFRGCYRRVMNTTNEAAPDRHARIKKLRQTLRTCAQVAIALREAD